MPLLTMLAIALGVLPALTSIAYFLFADRCLRRWLAEKAPAESAADATRPVTFFRPLKAGVPRLGEVLARHAHALRAHDQLLLGVAPQTAAAAVARDVRAAFPDRDITVVDCAPGVALNPKISKLLQMQPLARHEAWIIADSEAELDAEFLRAFRHEWQPGEVLTAGYRFVDAATLAQRLDAAAVLLTLWPGLAILRAAGRVRLTLGACTACPRSALEAVGGWAAFAGDLAEDYRLGQALAAAGRSIRLSRTVVTLGSDPLSWRDYWRHQRRVAITYRVANPIGYAGAFFAQGVTASLLCLLVAPAGWTLLLFGGAFLVRIWKVRQSARRLAFPESPSTAVVLLASLVETTCWMLSWFSRSVEWGGQRWTLSRAGKLRLPP